jgi:hypothetical protein
MSFELLLTIIILLIVLRIIFNLPNKHNFWNRQPVMTNYNHIGKIGLCPNFEIRIGDYKWDLPLNSQKLLNFLNENFSKSYNFPISIANYLIKSNRIITLVDTLTNKIGEIIGCISWEPFEVKIENRIELMYFVDNLCIHRNYRQKNLAVLLISKLINTISDLGFSNASFIFKIDKKPLPFLEITKSNYYYKDLSITNSQPKDFTIKNRDFLIQNLSRNLKKYVLISNETKETKKGYIGIEIKGIGIYGRIAEFRVYEEWKIVFDIDFIDFLDEKTIINREKWEEIEKKLKEYGVEIITLPYIGYNQEIIDSGNWNKANEVFWFFYNYSCHKITNKDFYLNFN